LPRVLEWLAPALLTAKKYFLHRALLFLWQKTLDFSEKSVMRRFVKNVANYSTKIEELFVFLLSLKSLAFCVFSAVAWVPNLSLTMYPFSIDRGACAPKFV